MGWATFWVIFSKTHPVTLPQHPRMESTCKGLWRDLMNALYRDRCCDLKNIFAKILAKKLAFFCSNYCCFFKNKLIFTLFFEKNANFPPKIG
jgi:hypothetical protein